MGLPAPQPVHARHRHGARRHHDQRDAPPQRAGADRTTRLGLTLALLLSTLAVPAAAERLRVAVYATELSRDGPGLLLRDIRRGGEAQVEAVVATIARANADVLLLTGIDWDLGGAALAALADRLAEAGAPYPHRFAAEPNAGRPTGLDLDGDGRTYRAADAQSWGLFSGQNGLALLSRLPIRTAGIRDFTALLWADLPGATLPTVDGAPFPSAEAQAVQRLSATGHWDVPLALPDGRSLRILAFAATPPVFDGPEDRNGLRNADEIRFWRLYLDGALGHPPPEPPFVLLGTANLDPVDGEGRHAAIRALLADPRLTDPAPRSPGAAAAADPAQAGDPARDTVDWWDENGGPGNLRVDYVLPAAGLTVLDAGVLWSDPAADPAPAAEEAAASRHRLVWVDLDL